MELHLESKADFELKCLVVPGRCAEISLPRIRLSQKKHFVCAYKLTQSFTLEFPVSSHEIRLMFKIHFILESPYSSTHHGLISQGT